MKSISIKIFTLIISLSLCFVSPAPVIANSTKTEFHATAICYGKSGMGKDLLYYTIDPMEENKIEKKFLLTFEIHGFEDYFKKDGRKLTDIGNGIVNYFFNNRDELYNTSLSVVCMANPDALSYGTTNNGRGRCQISQGIDINRDFDYAFKHLSGSRYHNLYKPFGSPEAKALRDLVLKLKPDTVIDFHGWEATTIGNPKLAKVFEDEFKIGYKCGFSKNTNGYFSAWSSKVCKSALLLEYPEGCALNTDKYRDLTIKALEKLFK